MFGSAILDVAIGIAFVYLLVAIICSAIREGIEARFKTRAAYLERGIRELLHDPQARGLAKSFYEHPLIFSLYSSKYAPRNTGGDNPRLLANGRGLPSYIPAKNFATTLMDIAARGPNPYLASDLNAPPLSLDTIRANLHTLECEPVQRVMLTALDAAEGNLELARQNIQDWYDSGMDRVSGWYKRSTQWLLFAIAGVLSMALNVNTITIADHLYRDDAARAAIVARAEAAAADTSFASQGYAAARQELQELRLPIGWSKGWGAPRPGAPWDLWNGLFGPVFGWLLTALAATIGAPFWFDLLNKMMVVRSTVKPREKSPEEGSEDRQPKASQRRPASEPPPARQEIVVSTAPAHTDTQPLAFAGATEPLVDACDIPITQITDDEDLPPAEGGVA